MLSNGNTKELISVDEAKKRFVRAKAIILLTDIYDMKGYIYKISFSEESHQELLMESERLNQAGKKNIIVGEYPKANDFTHYNMNGFEWHK